ncbi:hypothetical protein CRG98_032534, partial [Punica granatum]
MATLLLGSHPLPPLGPTKPLFSPPPPPPPVPRSFFGTLNRLPRNPDARARTSKFGNFLDLTPEPVPDSLEFDELSWFDPSDRRQRRFDMIVIGAGPAGLRLAEQ